LADGEDMTTTERREAAYLHGYKVTHEILAEGQPAAYVRAINRLVDEAHPDPPDLPEMEAETRASVRARAVEDAISGREPTPLWNDFDQPLLDLSGGELCPPLKVLRTWF
jgi:hypothetical protein